MTGSVRVEMESSFYHAAGREVTDLRGGLNRAEEPLVDAVFALVDPHQALGGLKDPLFHGGGGLRQLPRAPTVCLGTDRSRQTGGGWVSSLPSAALELYFGCNKHRQRGS